MLRSLDPMVLCENVHCNDVTWISNNGLEAKPPGGPKAQFLSKLILNLSENMDNFGQNGGRF